MKFPKSLLQLIERGQWDWRKHAFAQFTPVVEEGEVYFLLIIPTI
jgi:hypothetical protein